MSRLTIVEGNSNDKDNVRAIMVKGEKGEMGDLNHNDIIDNLTSTATNKVLSANQGKQLKNLIDVGDEENLTYIGDKSNPIYYGADQTGTNDSTDAINQCIQANKGGTINFTVGTYKISNSILLPFANNEKVSINGNGAKLIIDDDIEYLFYVGFDKVGDTQNDVGFPCFIKNLYIDGSNAVVNYGLYNVKGFKDLRIDNCTFYRVNNGILIGETTGNSSDLLITNSLLYGNGSEYDGTGIIVNCSDNNVNETRIYGFRKGFEINGYITICNAHVLLRWKEQTSSNFNPYPIDSEEFVEYYEQTNFSDVNSACRITNCYADSVHKFLEIGNISSHVILEGAFYYNARTGVNQHLIDCEGRAIKLNIINCQFALKQGTEVSILRCTNTSNPYFSNYSQITISGIEIVGIANLTNYCDIVLTGYTNQVHSNVSLSTNWTVVGVLSNFQDDTKCDVDLFVNGWKYSLRISEEMVNSVRTQRCMNYGGSTTNSNYTFGCIRENNICYLCLKTSSSVSIKVKTKLNDYNNLCFLTFPVYGASLYDTDLTLSNFTNLEPVQTVILKSALNITPSSAN